MTGEGKRFMFAVNRLLSGVAPATRDALQQKTVRRSFAVDEELLRIDQAPPGAYRLISGRVRSWRPLGDGRAVTLAYLAAGQVAGLVACARASVSPVIVSATQPVVADLWPIATLRHLVAADGAFARNLLAMVADYTVLIMEKLDDTMVPVEQRIARALLRLASEHGDWAEDDGVTVAVSRQELADLTGSTLFTASRTLSEWQRRGYVRSSRGRVEITDPYALAGIAGFDG